MFCILQQSDLLDTLSGAHNWYSCSHAKPTFCNVCRDLLSGVTSKGLSCEGQFYTVASYYNLFRGAGMAQ